MKPITLIVVFCFFFITLFTVAQCNPVPAPEQKGSLLITNCIAHLGNGQKIDNAVVGFREGKFTLVADAMIAKIDMTAFDKVTDAAGQHLYPGFIAPNSVLGLHEIDYVRATIDEKETGLYKPSVRSVIAYNTDSEIIPTVRSNGVLIGQVTPRGGIISGTSSVVQFDAWNWEDAVIKKDDGVHLYWPSVINRTQDKGVIKLELSKSYNDQLRDIRTLFNEAIAYCSKKDPVHTDLRYEALRGLLNGTMTLYIHADEYNQIAEAIQFKKEMHIDRMVLVEGYDSWRLSKLLRENNVGVMLRRVHELPKYSDDDVLLPYKLPTMLFNEGVMFCFQNEGEWPATNTRNLPFYAGTAVAYGLPYEEAVKALTLNAAQMMGIDSFCGSIEIGKDATFFLSQGDALDMLTNHLTAAWIQGRKISLTNKQVELYEKYKAKYDVEK